MKSFDVDVTLNERRELRVHIIERPTDEPEKLQMMEAEGCKMWRGILKATDAKTLLKRLANSVDVLELQI